MNLSKGEALATETFLINRQKLKAYADASGDQNPIHQNEAFAKSVGLPNVIAHGMYTMGLAGTYLSSINGSNAVTEFSAKFIKPVVVPEGEEVELEISGIVTDVFNGMVKIELSVICSGVKVLGNAKGTIKC